MDISEQPGFSNLKYKSLRICGGITFVAFVFIHIVLADCDFYYVLACAWYGLLYSSMGLNLDFDGVSA